MGFEDHWTLYFIEALLDQTSKEERRGTTLSKPGWRAFLSQFNEKSGRKYDKLQLRNKWDNLKIDWKVWDKLFGKETGLGWDSAKKFVTAPDEWWEKNILENPPYGDFRNNGLAFAPQLDILFKGVGVVATGQFACRFRGRLLG